LESAIKEFPEKVQIRLSSFVSSRVAQTIVDKSSIIEFENYYLPQIKRALNGELSFLKQLYKEINLRTERSEDPNSQFPIYEALLCQRLNKLNESNAVIENALKIYGENNTNPIYIDCLLIKVQNLEYVGDYHRSFEISYQLVFKGLVAEQQSKFLFFLEKSSARLDERKEKNAVFYNLRFSPKEDFKDTFWDYIVRSINTKTLKFKSAKDFDQIHDEMINKIDGFKELEVYCHKLLGVFLKDISLSGEFEIVFKDFLYVLEAEGKLDLLMNSKA
jgi:hypothetical protein